jgi:hypothetical protein
MHEWYIKDCVVNEASGRGNLNTRVQTRHLEFITVKKRVGVKHTESWDKLVRNP